MTKKIIIGVVGSMNASSSGYKVAMDLGNVLVDHGYHIISGGFNGIMEGVSRGARSSEKWDGNQVIGLNPGWNDDKLNPWIDIELNTGLGRFRNTLLVNTCDALVGVEGGSGTLSELALAWQEGKPICCLDMGTGWSSKLCNETLDNRRTDSIVKANTVQEVIQWLNNLFPKGSFNTRGDIEWSHGTVPCIHRIHSNTPCPVMNLHSSFGMAINIDILKQKLIKLESKVIQHNNKTNQKRRALVTFDDGYKDVLLLKRFFKEHPFLQPVLFISSSLLSESDSFNWFDIYYYLLIQLNSEEHLEGFKYPLPKKETLKSLTYKSQLNAIMQFIKNNNLEVPNISSIYLNKKEIEELVFSGWYLGSHGHYHHNLTLLEDDLLEAELKLSLDTVLDFGGMPWLAYPDGRWNKRIRKKSIRAGFTKIFTIDNELERGLTHHVERTMWKGDLIETD